MKKSSTYIFITAVAAFACLCGILFATSTPISSPEAVVTSEEKINATAFSSEKAKDMISLCSVSYEPQQLESMLVEAGYHSFEYFEKKGSDGIAVGIALKEEEEGTRIRAVFRGTYKEEWHSNFRIGEETEHLGFRRAADYVCSQIDDYILRQKKDNTKVSLELTGHSRGGAVANLAAKKFIEKSLVKDVIAYTFAAPNTTTSADASSPLYRSIYNITNPEDFICYIPLSKWGYTKYGVNIDLPEKGSVKYTESFNSVSEIYKSLTGRNFHTYKDGDDDVKSFISACEELSPTLQDYYKKEITIEPYTITLSEYMNSAATLLSGERSMTDAMLLISGSTSQDLAPITNFITAGIDPASMDENTDFTDTPIGSGHACETYMAWLEVLEEAYFLKIAKE